MKQQFETKRLQEFQPASLQFYTIYLCVSAIKTEIIAPRI